MSKYTIPDNGLSGLLRSVTAPIGNKTFEIKVLNLEASRKAWVQIQAWIVGIDAGATINETLAASGSDARTGAVEMVGHLGNLSERALDELTQVFAEKTSFKVQVRTPEGVREDIRFLKEPGALDAAFGGEFDLYLEWLNYCIALNFGKQIEKHVAALAAHKRVVEAAAKAKPTDEG